MEIKAFMEAVQIDVAPEPDKHRELDGPPHALSGDSLFWLHTVGMHKFERPELEVRDVPALFIPAACALLNGWGSYTASGPELVSGQALLNPDDVVPVTIRLVASPDPFWTEEDTACLRLVLESVQYVCERCGSAVH